MQRLCVYPLLLERMKKSSQPESQMRITCESAFAALQAPRYSRVAAVVGLRYSRVAAVAGLRYSRIPSDCPATSHAPRRSF